MPGMFLSDRADFTSGAVPVEIGFDCSPPAGAESFRKIAITEHTFYGARDRRRRIAVYEETRLALDDGLGSATTPACDDRHSAR